MASAVSGSVTKYIGELKAGVADAAQPLWERYFTTLVRRAQAKLRTTPRRAADEEDVALSAFDSFCAAVKQGRFPQLADRDDLWKILVTITDRKAADLAKYEGSRPGKGRRLLSEAALRGSGSFREGEGFAAIAGSEPSPEFAASVAEECRRLLDSLDDDVLRRVALDRLAGYKDAEIAARLGCTRRTVMRKLTLIRKAWQSEVVS
jgi:DNA-directed RNA polymerase specialized sigma24 family protein